METERPKLPLSVVVIGGAVGVVVALWVVRMIIGTVLGLLRLGIIAAVVVGVIALIVRVKPDRS